MDEGKNINIAVGGLNLDRSLNQVENGKLTYALNAVVENFDENGISYQNEPGNEHCFNFPEGFVVIGRYNIPEIKKKVFFLTNPDTNEHEIGIVEGDSCEYKTYIKGTCLNFHIDHPIHKVVHKITNCSVEIYWTDGYNPRRYLDLDNPPYKTQVVDGQCNLQVLDEIDCNKLNVQGNFPIPLIGVDSVTSGGNLISGTYQFAVQYSDALGNGYTSYYSVTNPLPIAIKDTINSDFSYNVGKTINLVISNLDTTGKFRHFNLAVIKTINSITSVELVGTYDITSQTVKVVYTGDNTPIKLTIEDIFEKFPIYEIADDVTTVQDVLVWKGLSSIDRYNLQKIANKIELEWQTWRIPPNESYADELNALNYRGYLRDEIYPFEIVFLLDNGKETDRFHIPGREALPSDLTNINSNDPDYIGEGSSSPRWKIQNTAFVTETVNFTDPNYKGPYQCGKFAYHESTETYPCDEEVWGDLAGKPIRHHRFPDVNVSPIFESPKDVFTNLSMDERAIYPLGVRVNVKKVKELIEQSGLDENIKKSIVGFKIVRGDRVSAKSVLAKGILRNVGKYNRGGTTYFFANYPYNDLNEDPFLLENSNSFYQECKPWIVRTSGPSTLVQYTDCFSNTLKTTTISASQGDVEICSLSKPITLEGTFSSGYPKLQNYDVYIIRAFNTWFYYIDYIDGPTTKLITIFSGFVTLKVSPSTKPTRLSGSTNYVMYLASSSTVKEDKCYPNNLKAFNSNDSLSRFVFNSPETSFGKPFLGNVLKIENVIYGKGLGTFSQVKKNANYRFLSREAQIDALNSSRAIAAITSPFSSSAMFQAYQSYLQIYLSGITRKNYGWSYNSIMFYNYQANVDNGFGIKQRTLDICNYLYPGFQSVGDIHTVNNFNRESSVYIKTKSTLPVSSKTKSLLNGLNSKIEDKNRFTISDIDCSNPEKEFDIQSVVYYASIKNNIPNLWGQIYSYKIADTGFQVIFNKFSDEYGYIFGGDTFIGKFAFKTKMPFFIDHRVGAPDDSDIFFDEIGNVAYPKYWHSSRSILSDFRITSPSTSVFTNLISIKALSLDCPNNQEPKPEPFQDPPVYNPNRTFYDGKMYLFCYGIPIFYCESSINLDLRQAFNNKEGDFYPRVSSGIPNDWLQESNVPISQDNTYFYNVTYSKQNKERFYSYIPPDWNGECMSKFPFRAIYSEKQENFVDNRFNNWLIYRPTSFFDFPQNFGKFTSIDGINNGQVLARFENNSLIYNALYTSRTDQGLSVYLGRTLFSKESPPLELGNSEIGYVGSLHKFLLNVPEGFITVDSKRGKVFLVSGTSIRDLSDFSSGISKFLINNLPFKILKYFPNVNIDNNFKGIGLHGTYDHRNRRVIITKLDYEPLSDEVKFDGSNFYIEELGIKKIVFLEDSNYFCNKSWTLSFNLNTGTWISFHSYLPNWYLADVDRFYSGINDFCDFEIIAAEVQQTTTTTTSTTTTLEPEGCNLEGFALDYDPTTTTTTTSTTTTTTTSTTTTTTTTADPCEGCPAEGTFVGYECIEGDTYEVYHNGCCGFYYVFFAPGCV